MTDWQKLTVADDRTHHCFAGQAAYDDRFDEVLKFHAPGLAPVQRGPEAWHIKTDGTAAYRQRYQRTFGFYEGFAAVVDKRRLASYSARRFFRLPRSSRLVRQFSGRPPCRPRRRWQVSAHRTDR